MSMHRNPTAKAASQRISEDVEAFIAGGNKIKKLGPLESAFRDKLNKRKRRKAANASLTDEQVRAIRSTNWEEMKPSHRAATQMRLARHFGVSYTTILRVVRKQVYAEVA